MAMVGLLFRIWRICVVNISRKKYDVINFGYPIISPIYSTVYLNSLNTYMRMYMHMYYQQYDNSLMPKSNRKGYFQQHLKAEGIQQQSARVDKQRGIRKEAKTVAKQARERKKIYMAHVQQRVNQLNGQLERLNGIVLRLKQQNQSLKQQLLAKSQSQVLIPTSISPLSKKQQQPHSINSDKPHQQISQPPTNSAFPLDSQASKTMRFDGLFKQIKNLSISLQNNNNEQISRSLSVLRDKYGISGRERLKTIDEMFDKVVSIMMPMHYRLLMQHCLQTRQFYSLLNTSSSSPNNINKPKIKLQQKTKQILMSIRPQIIKQREQYDRLLTNLVQLRTKIKAQNYKCQAIVDYIQDGIDPAFVGRLLLDLDFCRMQAKYNNSISNRTINNNNNNSNNANNSTNDNVDTNIQQIYPINYWDRCKDDGFQLVIPPKRIAESSHTHNQIQFHAGYAGTLNNNNNNQGFVNVDQVNHNHNKQSYCRFEDDLDIINELFF